MAVAELARNKLFDSARSSWGEGVAMTLMDYLPPGGWEQMATKADIERLRTEDLALFRADMDHGFTRLDGKIDAVEVRLEGKIDLVAERLVRLDQKVDDRFELLAARLDETVSRLTADLMERQFRFVIAMLTLLGVVATVVAGVIVARL